MATTTSATTRALTGHVTTRRSGRLPTDARRGPTHAARRLQAPRRDLRGEPLLRQPLRALGQRARPAGARARPGDRRAADAGGAGRHAVRLPAAERRQPDVAAADDHLHRPGAPASTASHFTNRPFRDRRLHQARGQDLPAPGRLRRRTACRRTPTVRSPAAAPATSCTASTRSSTRSTAVARTATRPAPTPSGSPRASTAPRSCRSTPTCTAGPRPKYVVADNFFQAAFGGSFLNHQWLIAARSPLGHQRPGADAARRTRCWTATGCPPATRSTRRPARSSDGQLTQECADPATSNDPVARLRRLRRQHDPAGQPAARRGGAQLPLIDDTQYPNIGDRLTDAGHQLELVRRRLGRRGVGPPRPAVPVPPPAVQLLRGLRPRPARPRAPQGRDDGSSRPPSQGHLPTVSFVKPYGAENEHPGYASEPNGSDHLVNLLKTITTGPQARQDAGGGDLRRVRRPVGPRVAAEGRQRGARAPGSRRW